MKIRDLHRQFIVSDYNELGLFAEFSQDPGEFLYVNVIQGRIYFIQDTIGTWFELIDREQQCYCRQ